MLSSPGSIRFDLVRFDSSYDKLAKFTVGYCHTKQLYMNYATFWNKLSAEVIFLILIFKLLKKKIILGWPFYYLLKCSTGISFPFFFL